MNIFEGARRVAKAIAGVVIFGSIIAAAMDKPYVNFYYAYDKNDALQNISECPSFLERFYPDVIDRPNVNATVCGVGSGPDEVKLSDAQLAHIDQTLTSKRLSDLGTNSSILLAVLIAGWALTWVIGWIVRGFMGIPIRQDHKNPSPELQK